MEDREIMAVESLSSTAAPDILLLGGGYTLQRVAELLPRERFVITSREERTCQLWREKGWISSQVSIDDRASLERVCGEYPSLRVIVDSVPPLRGHEDPAQGVANVVAAFGASQVKKIIYLSTTGVFGVRDGREVDESTPPQPWNEQGEARYLSELAYRQGPFAVTALRLPAIYGADRGVLQAIRRGTYRLVDDGLLWTNRIHVEDLAQVIVKSIDTESLPPVLCVTDDCPAQARDVARYICEREGLPFPQSVSSAEVVQAGAYTMVSNQRVSNALMKRVLNVTLRYPSFREGMT